MGRVGSGGGGEVRQLFADVVPKKYAELAKFLDGFVKEGDYEELYSPDMGRPSVPPVTLVRVTLLQYLDNFSDRRAADAARFDLKWMYVLNTPLKWSGFNYSDLSNFRERMAEVGKERELFDKLVAQLQKDGFIKSKKVRADSYTVLSQVQFLSDLELIYETCTKLLDALADHSSKTYNELGGELVKAFEKNHPPFARSRETLRKRLREYGDHARRLLETCRKNNLENLDEHRLLEQAFNEVYHLKKEGGEVVVEVKDEIKRKMVSPHDPDARVGKRREKTTHGYQAHVCETIPEKRKNETSFIVTCRVNAADRPDHEALCGIARDAKEKIGAKELSVDMGYTIAREMVLCREMGVEIVGRVKPDSSSREGFRRENFRVDVEGGVALCPAGRRSARVERHGGKGLDGLAIFFFGAQCPDCPNHGLCTSSKNGRRLKVRVVLSPVIDEYRERAKSVKYQKRLKLRCPVEGTVSEAKRHGAGKARYRGLSKVEAQQLLTATAINVKRRVAAGLKLKQTGRTSLTHPRTSILRPPA